MIHLALQVKHILYKLRGVPNKDERHELSRVLILPEGLLSVTRSVYA